MILWFGKKSKKEQMQADGAAMPNPDLSADDLATEPQTETRIPEATVPPSEPIGVRPPQPAPETAESQSSIEPSATQSEASPALVSRTWAIVLFVSTMTRKSAHNLTAVKCRFSNPALQKK